ncbi:MAG: carboxypeptidase regulatory-like domain-containing protein [Bryobacterales bacterium]|nr:carboxypeptidase regulatory-like domain-containing protein [Bryobacterales bacterium]
MVSILLVSGSGLVAQAPVGQETRQCRVAGTVKDALTGAGIAGVVVYLFPCDGRLLLTTRSRADGEFAIEEVEPGCYRLRLATMYVPYAGASESKGSERQGATFWLAPGEERAGLDFKLEPGAAVAGRVLDEESEPVPELSVMLLRTVYDDGTRRLLGTRGAKTDERGAFRVSLVPAGRYFVYVHGPALTRDPGDAEGGRYAGGYYYPGVATFDGAVAIEVGARDELAGIDLRLKRGRVATVRGNVTPATALTQKVSLWLVPDEWLANFGRVTQLPAQGGRFEFPAVAPGRYRLVNHDPGTSELALDVGERNLDEIEVVVGDHARCTVEVSAEEADNLSFSTMGVALVNIKNSRHHPLYGMTMRANLDEGGRTEVTVSPGNRVHFAFSGLPETAYIKAARTDGADVLEEGFEPVNNLPVRIEVLVSNKAGQTTGVVKDEDGEPVPAATVVMIPEFRRRNTVRFVRWTATDEKGFYRIGSLEPGEYKVYAWTDVEPHRWNDPEFLRPYLSKGERVKVEPEAVRSVDLTALN